MNICFIKMTSILEGNSWIMIISPNPVHNNLFCCILFHKNFGFPWKNISGQWSSWTGLVIWFHLGKVHASNSLVTCENWACHHKMISRKLISSLLKQTGNCHVKISVRFNSSEPLKTCLYDFHVASGGKMVDFAGLLTMFMFDMCCVISAHVLTPQATWCQFSTPTRGP